MKGPKLSALLFLVGLVHMATAQTDYPVFRWVNNTRTVGTPSMTIIDSSVIQAYATLAVALTLQTGGNIESQQNACSSNIQSLSSYPCDSNADCVDVNATLAIFRCQCQSGFGDNSTESFTSLSTFTPNGTSCYDIDECNGNTTICGAGTDQCINEIGNYSCSCLSGYDYNNATQTCDDILECSSATLNNCSNNGMCNNTVGGFTCSCNAGFTGDGVNCTDNDECNDGTANCASSPPGNCLNNAGSFMCSCNNGYSGDGLSCNDINECLSSPCDGNATCTNNNGSFTCACDAGFSGDGFTCGAASLDYCYRLSITFPDPTSGDTTSRAADAEMAVQDFLGELVNGNVGFSYENYTSTFEAVLGNNSVTEFIVRLCLNGSSQDAAQLTETLRNFTFTSTVSGTTISVLEYDECLTNYGNCSTNADCMNTDGDFQCVCFEQYSDQSTNGINGTTCELPTNHTCSSNSVDVTAYLQYFTNLGIAAADLCMGTCCNGTVSGNVILYSGECGAAIESNDTHISYKWNLTNSNDSADITIGTYVTIPITCVYLSSRNISTNFSAERFNIIGNGTSESGSYTFRVRAYSNPQATLLINGPVTTNQEICFQVDTTSTLSSNLRTRIGEFSTSAGNGGTSTQLMRQGCRVALTDSNRRIRATLDIVRNGVQNTAMVCLTAHFYGTSRVTEATFAVNICLESGGNTCEYSCTSRRKRAVLTHRAKRETTIQSGTVVYAIEKASDDVCNLNCGEGGFCALDQNRNPTCGCADGYVRNSAGTCRSTSPEEADQNVPVTMIVLIAVAVFLAILISCLILIFVLWRRRENKKEINQSGYVNTGMIDG